MAAMKKPKFYALVGGPTPGIFTCWAEAVKYSSQPPTPMHATARRLHRSSTPHETALAL